MLGTMKSPTCGPADDIAVLPPVVNKIQPKTLSIAVLSDGEQVLVDNPQEKKFAKLHKLLMKPRVYLNEPFSSEVHRLWTESRQFSHMPQIIKLWKMPTDKEIQVFLHMGIFAGSQPFFQVKDCWLPLLSEAPASE